MEPHWQPLILHDFLLHTCEGGSYLWLCKIHQLVITPAKCFFRTICKTPDMISALHIALRLVTNSAYLSHKPIHKSLSAQGGNTSKGGSPLGWSPPASCCRSRSLQTSWRWRWRCQCIWSDPHPHMPLELAMCSAISQLFFVPIWTQSIAMQFQEHLWPYNTSFISLYDGRNLAVESNKLSWTSPRKFVASFSGLSSMLAHLVGRLQLLSFAALLIGPAGYSHVKCPDGSQQRKSLQV